MLTLAWRNLWRQRSRSSIMLSVLSLSFALMLVSMGVGDHMHAQMELAAIQGAGGNVLVHAKGYWASQSSELTIKDPGPLLERAAKLEHAQHVVPRVRVMGLLNSARGAAGVSLMGIVPEKEAVLEDYARFLVEGTFLDGSERDPLVLGKGVAEELELELGDKVVLTATAPNGEVVRALFRLSGIIETGVEVSDHGLALTSLSKAQDALAMGQGLNQIGIVIGDDRHRYRVRDALARELGEAASGLELLTWDEALPEMVGFIEIDDAFFYIYAIAIFFVVAFGVANTFLMSVLQRVRELGLLAALGLGPMQVARLVFAETLLLASLSLLLGYALGLLGHWAMLHYGVDMRDIYDADLEVSGVALVDTIMRSKLILSKWLGAGGVLLLGLVLSALYPAWRASRLDPVAAMRTYE